MEWLAQIDLGDGDTITLQPDFKWVASGGEVASAAAKLANMKTNDIGYSVGHGYPGALIGHEVAKLLGTNVTFPARVEDEVRRVY